MQYENFAVMTEGFAGRLVVPDGGSEEAVIVVKVSGKEYMDPVEPIQTARCFAEHGFMALALTLCAGRDLPQGMSRIPLEFVGNAANYLKIVRQCRTVTVYGEGVGSIIACQAAAAFRDIDQTVLVSPTHIIPEGMMPDRKNTSGHSLITLGGREQTFIPFAGSHFERERNLYEAFYNAYSERTQVRHASLTPEKIQGSVLIVASERDELWPSAYSAKYLEKRMNRAGFTFPMEVAIMSEGSHLIGLRPLQRSLRERLHIAAHFKYERKTPMACKRAREETEKRVIEWIKN